MVPERFIHEINLSTGATRRVPRSDVDEDALTQLRPILVDALAERARMIEIPQTNDCAITATRIRRALLATLWTQSAALRTSGRARAPLVTLAVVVASQDVDLLWKIVHEWDLNASATLNDQAPAVPWLAVRHDYSLLMHHDLKRPLDDLERAIAWAWLELADEPG